MFLSLGRSQNIQRKYLEDILRRPTHTPGHTHTEREERREREGEEREGQRKESANGPLTGSLKITMHGPDNIRKNNHIT